MSVANQWSDLYERPDPGTIFDLGNQGFKDFIRYVFERAGYHVEPFQQAGADFELRNENKTVAYVATSCGVANVGPKSIVALNGIVAPTRDAMRYFISSGDFAPAAYDEAKKMRHLRLLNGDKLQRYISYVRGTRHPKSKNAPISPAQIFDNEPEKRPTSRTKVIVLANNKGGVCKTTSALAIGLILASEKKKKVLFVDVDDQANLTQGALGLTRSGQSNISDYFVESATLAQLIEPTRFHNAWIIPSGSDLRLTLTNTVDWMNAEQMFVENLHHDSIRVPGTGEDFDWIILDTPPSLSLYTRAALLAAHYVLAPYTPSALDRAGFKSLIQTLDEISCIAKGANQTQMLGCFNTRWKRTVAAKQEFDAMKRIAIQGGAPLFETDIIEDAVNPRKLFGVFDEDAPAPNLSKIHGALDDYRDLVKEIQNHVGDN